MMKRLLDGGALVLALVPTGRRAQATEDERLVRQAIDDSFAPITDHDVTVLERAFHPDTVSSAPLPSGRTYRAPTVHYVDYLSLLKIEGVEARRLRSGIRNDGEAITVERSVIRD